MIGKPGDIVTITENDDYEISAFLDDKGEYINFLEMFFKDRGFVIHFCMEDFISFIELMGTFAFNKEKSELIEHVIDKVKEKSKEKEIHDKLNDFMNKEMNEVQAQIDKNKIQMN